MRRVRERIEMVMMAVGVDGEVMVAGELVRCMMVRVVGDG